MLSLNIFASQKLSVHSAPHKIFGPPPPKWGGGDDQKPSASEDVS